jgi:hypothetical protein
LGIFKTKWMARFVRRERISDHSLREAILRAEGARVDADLSGGMIKQRVARTGQGRSGGYRMLVAYRTGDRAVFLYGFAKDERENIDPDQLLTLRDIAASLLAADDEQIEQALKVELSQEVRNDYENPA